MIERGFDKSADKCHTKVKNLKTKNIEHLKQGLDLLRLRKALEAEPQLLAELLCMSTKKTTATNIIDMMVCKFSAEGSSRKNVQKDVFDKLCSWIDDVESVSADTDLTLATLEPPLYHLVQKVLERHPHSTKSQFRRLFGLNHKTYEACLKKLANEANWSTVLKEAAVIRGRKCKLSAPEPSARETDLTKADLGHTDGSFLTITTSVHDIFRRNRTWREVFKVRDTSIDLLSSLDITYDDRVQNMQEERSRTKEIVLAYIKEMQDKYKAAASKRKRGKKAPELMTNNMVLAKNVYILSERMCGGVAKRGSLGILSTNIPGTNIPLLQLDRMPFELIQYQLEFYSSTNVHQVTIAPDYAVWLLTMCSEFPTRFMRLFRGPGWSGVPEEDAKNPLKVTALEHLAKHKKPGTRVWFKADACDSDIKVALQTSVKGKWAGDVDLGDGSLQKLRKDSDRRVACVKKAGKVPPEDVEEDIVFLEDGLEVAQKKYTEKFRQPNSSTELLKGLAWERVEYHTLLVQAKTFYER
ncbi:hypothetical protein Bbelb_291730 [Branchiostoma belcheri]|nr:hypothetical protein Bbelb_291730 [Branchiostoma belcheri]